MRPFQGVEQKENWSLRERRGRERENVAEEIFEGIMPVNFPNMVKDIYIYSLKKLSKPKTG